MEAGNEPARQDVSAGRDAYAAVYQIINNVYQASKGTSPTGPGHDEAGLRVYVSSTFQDLQACRVEIRLALQRLGLQDVAAETYTAESRPLDRCLAEVRSSDLFIGVFAWRYGHVPGGHEKSITELEYDAAEAAGLPRLIFLQDENAPWPMASVDRGAAFEKIEALRRRLVEHNACDYFAGAEDLRAKLAEAMSREIQRQGDGAPDTRPFAAGVDEWARYRHRLIAEYRRLDLDALTPPERDEYLAIGLREVFVEPNVREDVPPPELPKELLVKVQEATRILPEDVPYGIDRQELERTQRSYRARPVKSAFGAVGQPGAGLSVLLGDPGAGKSTLVRYLALTSVFH
jgi:hypothetical protein